MLPTVIDSQEKWTVVQLGAREHYAIARALHDSGRLQQLVTDRWSVARPVWAGFLGSRISEKVTGRYDSGLADANVVAFNIPSILHEATASLHSRSNWARIIQRNRWFQERAVAVLKDRLRPGCVVFAYSYAARKVLELARGLGCTTILGQIDPGIFEEDLVARHVEKRAELNHLWSRAPRAYWEDWRRECELADLIAVNSRWSRHALIESGIETDKISILPLAFGTDDQPTTEFRRDYPAEFSRKRPLRVLFLGQAIPRKGIHLVLEAAQDLINLPVEISIVGDAGHFGVNLIGQANIKYVGNRPRNEAQDFYCHADVFLFPTLSDGFGSDAT